MTAELVSCTSTEISRYISAVISNAWLVQGWWGGDPKYFRHGVSRPVKKCSAGRVVCFPD